MTTGICRGDHAKPASGCSHVLPTTALALKAPIVSIRMTRSKQDVEFTATNHQYERVVMRTAVLNYNTLACSRE